MSKTAPKAPNFGALLEAAPSEVNRPKPLPVGGYLCIVQGLPKYDKSSKKGTEYTEFTLKPIEALEDVDKEALEEMGGLGDKTLRVTFYLTEDAIYRLDEFHEHLGIELDPKVTRRQRNEEAPGKEVIAYVRHESSQDGQNTFARVGATAVAA